MAKKGVLTVRIVGDEKSFTGALKGAQKSAEGFASKLPGVLGVAGAAGGAALAAGLVEAFQRDAATDKLGAALNLSDSEMEAAGRIAGEVWSEAFGDNIGEVNSAIEGVASTLGSFGELGEEAIGGLTRDALTIADVFNVDVSEAISAAGVLLNSGLVSDAEEAFDTITRGLQEMPAALRGELLEASTEYGQFFDALGFDAEEAFAILIQGAEDGQYGIDKAGDAIKEFGIRSTDMSTATQEAFEIIGLDAGKMAERILEGGDVARDAFDEIIEGLLAIEDPVAQANAAVALFGTPLEDLSVNEIPQFLESLLNIENGLGDVEDATDQVGETAYDNIKTRWTEAWRSAQEVFLTFADENVIPAVERILDAFEEDGLEGAIEQVKEEWEKAWPEIEEWLNDTVAPALAEFGKTVGGLMARELWNGFWNFLKTNPLEGAIPEIRAERIVRENARGPGPSKTAPSNPSRTTPRSAEPPNQTTTRSRSGGMMFMHDGGIVPGRPGTNVPIIARPGEQIIPVGGTAQGVTFTVNQTFNGDVTRATLTEARHQQRLAFLEAV